MSYPTLDYLPDLTKSEMAAAQTLSFAPFFQSGIPSSWDFSADYSSTAPYASLRSLFSFTAVQGATYDVFSHSFFDPFLIRLYDHLGNVVAVDNEQHTSTYGTDFLANYVAPYSGTFYVSAGWDQAISEPFVSVNVYASMGSIPPVVTPPVVNVVTGTAGNDRFAASKNIDTITGGAGFDTVSYTDNRTNYAVFKKGDVITVSSKSAAADVDTLRGVELVQFADKPFDLKYNDLTQALYIGYFGRAADAGGLQNFQNQLASLNAPLSATELSARYATEAPIRNLIDSFGLSTESKALYAGDTKAFVKAIFNNVLNRDPQQAGLDFWSSAIDAGTLTRANASLSIMAGAQSNTTAQGMVDKQLVDNKISVASNFTFGLDTEGKGLSYAGSSAAASARNLLKAVTSTTDIDAYQATVKLLVTNLPVVPQVAYDHAADLPATQADGLVIALTGVDGGSGSSALSF